MSEGVTVFLRWWALKCGRNWAILISIATGATAIFVAYSTLAPVVADLRPWTARWETALIADKVYPRALADQQTKTLSLENRLKWLRERGLAGKLVQEQWAEIPVIEGLIWDSKAAEAKIIREQTLFEIKREYR
jgi:hypothetical protein